MTTTPAPPSLDVHGSRLKLVLGATFLLPVLPVAPIMAVWWFGMLLAWDSAAVAAVPGGLWFLTAVSAFAWWFLGWQWRNFSGPDAFMRLTPEGLVMSSLGSDQPIPWDKVATRIPRGRGGVFMFRLDLGVDPHVHTKLLGVTPIFRRGDPDRAVVTLPAVFTVARRDILRRIGEFKEWWELSEEPPRTASPTSSSAASAFSWQKPVAVMLLAPALVAILGAMQGEPAMIYAAGIMLALDIVLMLRLRSLVNGQRPGPGFGAG